MYCERKPQKVTLSFTFTSNMIYLLKSTARHARLPEISRRYKMAAGGFINLRQFHLLTATEEDCRGWMRQNGLLANGMICPKCGTPMEEKLYAKVQEWVIWRCPPKQCRHTVSIRHGSFFERSHLPLTKLGDLVFYWTTEMSNDEIEYQVPYTFNVSYAILCLLSCFQPISYNHAFNQKL